MSRIALGLQTLRAPSAIPALRPICSELSADPALCGTPLADIADQMVDAINTLDGAVRNRLPA